MKRHWIEAKKGFISIILMLSLLVFYSASAAPIKYALLELMDEYTKSGRMPGIVFGVYIDDFAPIYLSSGFSNIQTKEPIHQDALFKFGSSIKTLTAMILLNKLTEENISIHRSIEAIIHTHPNDFSKRLEELTKKYDFVNQISINQLLNHTSQLVDEQITTNYLEEFSREKDSFIKINHHLRHSFARGLSKNKFEYANVNYILLGKIIEILYNKPFHEVIEEALFIKLNLKNAHYYYSQSDIQKWCPLQAHAYEPTNLGSVAIFKDRPIIQNYHGSQLDYIDLTCAYDPSWDDGPAGALLASPKDMGALAKFIFSNNDPIAKNYWSYIKNTPDNPNTKARFGPIEMNYKLGIWKGQFANGFLFWRMIGEQWGFSGGAIFVPKQKEMGHSVLLVYAINTDQSRFLEGRLITRALHIIEKS